MKPARFEYVGPRSEGEALAALAEHGDGAKVLAGGQSLIPLMNFPLAQPTARRHQPARCAEKSRSADQMLQTMARAMAVSVAELRTR